MHWKLGSSLAYFCVTMIYYIFRVISHRKLKSFMTGLPMAKQTLVLISTIHRRLAQLRLTISTIHRRLAHNELNPRQSSTDSLNSLGDFDV